MLLRQSEFHASLRVIEQAELARALAEPELAYIFKHALVQDTAYSTLLKQQRKRFHQLVATSLQDTYPEQLDENAPRLAQHYAEAGDDAKTFQFAARAGDAAARRFAYPEARLQYGDALDALARLPDTAEERILRADTLIKQVSVSLRAVGPAETIKRLTDAEAIAGTLAERTDATREDRLRLARVHFWQGHALLHHNEARAAIQKMLQVLAVARAENEAPLLAVSAGIVGRSVVLQGRFAQAIPILTDAITALEGTPELHEWIFSVGIRGTAIAFLGEITQGVAEGERALARAQQVGTLTGSALALLMLALTSLFVDALASAAHYARAVIEIAAQTGDRLHAYLGHSFLGWAQTRTNDLDAAETSFAQGYQIGSSIGNTVAFSDWFLAARAERELYRRAYTDAITLARQALALTEKSGALFSSGLAHRICGQALGKQNQSDNSTAENHFVSALALFSEGDAQIEVARTHLAWGTYLRDHENHDEAREHFEKAAAQFQASGLTRELEETRALFTAIP